MKWNLVDHLSAASGRRAFYPPLASIAPGKLSTRSIDRTAFAIGPPAASNNNGVTLDVPLNIRITPPFGGFVDEPASGLTDSDSGFVDSFALPDPLVRLHAIGSCFVRYKPTDATRGKLLLKLGLFLAAAGTPRDWGLNRLPPWWRQWVSAGCIPTDVIYENVDFAKIQELLGRIAAPIDTTYENRVAPTYGLLFPAEVTAADKNAFITQFLAGNDDYFLYATAGAYIGMAAQAPPASNMGTDSLLTLHATYHDHTTAVPHPLNPLELFYLLFGNDSVEAVGAGPTPPHPLLKRIDELGSVQPQQSISLETKRTLLRPPLRTSKRVAWEARQEILNHHLNWRKDGNLGAGRTFNTHSRGGMTYDFGYSFNDSNKCNLFVSDICLRAGFRVCLHTLGGGSTVTHYNDANGYSNHAHDAPSTANERTAMRGAFNRAWPDTALDPDITWAWKIETWLRSQCDPSIDANERLTRINNAILEEGRCFILAVARPRQFNIRHMKATECTVGNLEKHGTGHIVIVDNVSRIPAFATTLGRGLTSIAVNTFEAGTNGGANSREYQPALSGWAPTADSESGFVRIHLFELQPGKDPHTLQGLRNLNISNSNPNMSNPSADWVAKSVPIDRDTNGGTIPPTQWCHDNYPSNTASLQPSQ
jgi:hypothetical protein